jgi:hypothetical protein
MAELRSYHPSWRERAANFLLGDYPSQPRYDFVTGLLGTSGLPGTGSFGLLDLSPVGGLLGAQEEARMGDYQAAALAMMPGARVAKAAGKAQRSPKFAQPIFKTLLGPVRITPGSR